MTKKEEILGRSILDVFPDNPDDPDATGVENLRESLNRVVISRKADSIAVQKYDIRRPDGTFEERWWTPAKSPIFSSDGTLKCIVHNVEDITAFIKHLKIKKSELKSSCKAEREADETETEVFIQGQKLQEVNRRLRLARQTITTLYNNVVELKKTKENRAQLAELVEQVNDGIFSTNLDGIIVSINSGVKKIYGYTEEEIKGKPITVLVPPERVNESVKILHMIRNGEAVRDLETVRMRKDGSFVSVLMSVNPLRDLNGKIVGTAAIVHDITERKRSEQALRESEERFRTLADNISQFAWTADTGGEILWVNKRWYDYSGITFEDVQKWGWVKFLHPDQIDSVVPKIRRSIETGEFWEDNLRLRGKDGNYRWFLSRAMPKKNEKGDIVQWFGTATDITEIRELEEKLRRERELFETIVENVPVIITLYDPEEMKVEFNKAFHEITGWTNEDLVDHDAMEPFFP
jgi:PAS domain S-box-containing protein